MELLLTVFLRYLDNITDLADKTTMILVNMNFNVEALKMHEENKGKIAIKSKVKVESKNDLMCSW